MSSFDSFGDVTNCIRPCERTNAVNPWATAAIDELEKNPTARL
ncbi:hypothetical protein [Leptolyngbya sp. KIOST-1]|nr:hypothetical protein [Leptolyngbya sp. KIOST-1]